MAPARKLAISACVSVPTNRLSGAVQRDGSSVRRRSWRPRSDPRGRDMVLTSLLSVSTERSMELRGHRAPVAETRMRTAVPPWPTSRRTG